MCSARPGVRACGSVSPGLVEVYGITRAPAAATYPARSAVAA